MLLEQILPNCALYSHQVKGDDRGSLIALETAREIPFPIERVYFVFETRLGVDRGFHAHKSLEQWAICVSGACTMTMDDGRERRSVRLDSPQKGLYIGRGIWREMSDFSPDAVLMVIASTRYDEADYIRSYEDFLDYAGSLTS